MRTLTEVSCPEMIDFEVQRCTRRCAKTDRELEPGEECYSVLLSEGAEVVRRDFSREAWEGPPAEAIGWWKSRIPDANAKKANWAPNDVMLDYFQQLERSPEKHDVRYVLALLLTRRRILRLEDTETDDDGRETHVLFCPRNEVEYRVAVCLPDRKRTAEIQEDLARLLLADGT